MAAASMAALADGPWRARRSGWRGRGRERVGSAAGSAQSGRMVLFFSNLFFMAETIPEIAKILLKARKIHEKSQKLQEFLEID
jgi:hypothetical protein